MGGNKKNQRTKGNTRPSNSSHTAVLLSNQFNNLGLKPELVPLTALLDNCGSLDPDLSISFKKMIKKDSVTKVKALEEFIKLCQEKDLDLLGRVLSLWSRLYNKLCVDTDYKVREMTQAAQLEIVKKLGRNLAPQLKSIIGCWTISQCDPHNYSATLSQKAFEIAFSTPDKQTEVFSFCQEEILAFVTSNILEAPPPKTKELLEESRYSYIVSTSLGGLELFISKVKDPNPDLVAPLLCSPKFWKLAKHKDSQIRSAWYKLLARICQTFPKLAQENGSRICPLTLGCLNEKDPQVSPALMDAALFTVAFISDCWTYINIKKAFLPQLWSLLKEADTILSSSNCLAILIPIVFKLPPQELTDSFFNTFFENHLTGLLSIKNYKSQSSSMLESYLNFAYRRCEACPAILVDWVFKLIQTLITTSESINSSLMPQIGNWLLKLENTKLEIDNKPLANELIQLALQVIETGNEDQLARITLLLVKKNENGLEKSKLFSEIIEGLSQTLFSKCPKSDYLNMLAQLVSVYPNILNSLIDDKGLYWDNLKPWLVDCQKDTKSLVTITGFLIKEFNYQDVLEDLLKLNNADMVEFIMQHYQDLEKIYNTDFLRKICEESLLSTITPLSAKGCKVLVSHLTSFVKSSPQSSCFLFKSLITKINDSFQSRSLKDDTLQLLISIIEAVFDLYKEDHDGLSLVVKEIVKASSHPSTYLTTEGHNLLFSCWPHIQPFFSDRQIALDIAHNLHQTLFYQTTEDRIPSLIRTSILFLNSISDEKQKANLFKIITPTASEWQQLYIKEGPIEASFEHIITGMLASSLTREPKAPSTTLDYVSFDIIATSTMKLVEEFPQYGDSHLAHLALAQLYYKTAKSVLLDQMNSSMSVILDLKPNETMEAVFDLSLRDGYLRSLCLAHLLHNLSFNSGLLKNLPPTLDDIKSVGELHTLQVFLSQSHHISLEKELGSTFNLALFSSSLNLELDGVGILIRIDHLANLNPDVYTPKITDVAAIEWNCEVVNFIDTCVVRSHSLLECKHWDFILCTMSSWLETYLSDPECPIIFKSRLAKLMYCLHSYFSIPDQVKPDLLVEWKELFSVNYYKILLPIFLNLIEIETTSLFVPWLCQAIAQYDTLSLDNLPLLLKGCHSKFSPIRQASYCLVRKLLPILAQETQNADENTWEFPEAFESIIKNGPEIYKKLEDGLFVSGNLSDNNLSDCVSHILVWLTTIEYISMASLQAKCYFANYIKEKSYLDVLLKNLFLIMPENPVLDGADNMFTKQPSISFLETSLTQEQFEHLACNLYLQLLLKLPAVIRHWWNSMDKRMSDLVNGFTTKWVSNVICAREIPSSSISINNMNIKMRPSVREVVANYTMEEVTMELIVQLPPNHPLSPAGVETSRRVGISTQEWRKWMKQLLTFLTQQNGSIVDGLTMWKKNIDKKFEGVEECTICYYVLHGATSQLPKLSCKTCHKKFHSACLYKWFNTSNNPLCPLCRNPFM